MVQAGRFSRYGDAGPFGKACVDAAEELNIMQGLGL
jgi:hypothetical protein